MQKIYERVLSDGTVLYGYPAPDGGFMIKRGLNGPAAGAWRRDQPEVWSEFRRGQGWCVLGELTVEEVTAAQALRAAFFGAEPPSETEEERTEAAWIARDEGQDREDMG